EVLGAAGERVDIVLRAAAFLAVVGRSPAAGVGRDVVLVGRVRIGVSLGGVDEVDRGAVVRMLLAAGRAERSRPGEPLAGAVAGVGRVRVVLNGTAGE